MTKRATRQAAGIAGLALAGLLLAFPAVVAATTNGPIAQTGGMTATFPLLGTSLKVDVTLTAVGDISVVALDPTGIVSQTAADTHMVKFSNAAGTAKVSVRAGGDSLSIKAKATLANLTGAATWASDVFGTGTKSTVAYTIGKDGRGNPTLVIGAVSTPAGITSAVVAPTSKSHDDKAGVSGGVTFTMAGYEKDLWISVSVRKEDGSAKLDITLSGRDKLKLSGLPAALAGARVWNAHLCDGTAVSVAYHVAADGTVVYDSAGPGAVTEKSQDNGFIVRFNGTNVGLAVRIHANGDGTFTLQARGFSGFCGGKGDGHAFGGFGGFGGFGHSFDKGGSNGGDSNKGESEHDGSGGTTGAVFGKHHG